MTKFLFALKESILSLKRFVTWLSIATIAAAIFILGLFLLVSHNLHNSFKDTRNQVAAEIFLKDDIGEEPEIYRIFANQEWIRNITYISKQEAVKRLSTLANGDMLVGLEENPLPPSIVIHFREGKDLAEMADKVDKILENRSEILSRYVPTNTMKKLDEAYKIFIYLSVAWAMIIVFGSIFVVTNTIKLAMISKEESIRIMELVGADKDFIRLPFVLEGLLQGIISGAISAALISIIGTTIKFFPPLDNLPNFYIGFLFFCGLLFGITGSRIAISRYTR